MDLLLANMGFAKGQGIEVESKSGHLRLRPAVREGPWRWDLLELARGSRPRMTRAPYCSDDPPAEGARRAMSRDPA